MDRICFVFLLLSMSIFSGCSPKLTSDVTSNVSGGVVSGSPVVSALPSQRVYRMRGDYANLVPVTLDQNGNIISYPDPIDVSDSAKPVNLGDGWFLDRRGVGPNSAFTNYTYDEYHALKHVPSLDELKSRIVARHAITEMWDCGTSHRTIDEYRKLIKSGFPGCKNIVKSVSLLH